MSDIDWLLDQAQGQHAAGRLDVAEPLYRALLALAADHAEAHHGLGVLSVEQGRGDTGLFHLRRALELAPEMGRYWVGLADGLLMAGHPHEALRLAEQASVQGLEPRLLSDLRERIQAGMASEPCTDRTIPEVTSHPDIPVSPELQAASLDRPEASLSERPPSSRRSRRAALQHARKASKQGPRAGSSARKARTATTPQEQDRVVSLIKSGRLTQAEAAAQQLIERYPEDAFGWKARGTLLMTLGQTRSGAELLERAIALDPRDAECLTNLGSALKHLGRLGQAAERLRQAIVIRPEFASAHNHLGLVLWELGQLTDALQSLERAVSLDPKDAIAESNRGIVLQDLGRIDEALGCYGHALEIQPGHVMALQNRLFAVNYHPDLSDDEVMASYREYDRRFCMVHRESWRSHDNLPDPNRRLKIGYVSPDFRQHPARHFLEPLLAGHDKACVEVTAYAALKREDEVTLRYKSYVDHWMPTDGMTDAALAQRIRNDRIDILVDLAGHTSESRLAVFARKPAPIAVTWLGYGCTTGLSAIDYFLTDPIVCPAGGEALFSETPWRIANPSFAYRPDGDMGAIAPLPALANGFVTFGSLTRAIRVNYRVIRAWAAILRRVPGSRLIIDSRNFADPAAQGEWAERFAGQGIGSERLLMGYHSPPWGILHSMDIGLDCFPHNSGTTLFEHLYQGTPFVTLAGRPGVGRLGASILHGVGHPEWIAESEEHYIERAVTLASDLPALSKTREGLRNQMRQSPLMDEAGFCRRVEQAYREMWLSWCGTIQ